MSPLAFSNSKPLARNPLRKREGASKSDPIALVNCLNVNNPKSASSINHLTKMVIYFAMGILSKSGNSIIQLKKEFEKKYKKKIRINDRKKKLFLVLISNTFIFDQ
tara:strand:- start:163 stop:480 length:318 start_codon:yes stop_codon:yes gene_type:complete